MKKQILTEELEKSSKIEKELKIDYLNNLKSKIEMIPQNCPEELKLYWNPGGMSAILPLLNAKTKNTQERMNFLERELGKKGKSLEWFLEEFKIDIKE
jgi:hypothetical protein